MNIFKKKKQDDSATRKTLNLYKCTYVIKTKDAMITTTTYVIASSIQIAEMALKIKIQYEIIGLNIEKVDTYDGRVLI